MRTAKTSVFRSRRAQRTKETVRRRLVCDKLLQTRWVVRAARHGMRFRAPCAVGARTLGANAACIHPPIVSRVAFGFLDMGTGWPDGGRPPGRQAERTEATLQRRKHTLVCVCEKLREGEDAFVHLSRNMSVSLPLCGGRSRAWLAGLCFIRRGLCTFVCKAAWDILDCDDKAEWVPEDTPPIWGWWQGLLAIHGDPKACDGPALCGDPAACSRCRYIRGGGGRRFHGRRWAEGLQRSQWLAPDP